MPKASATAQDPRAVKQLRVKYKTLVQVALFSACAISACASEHLIYSFDGSGGVGPQAGLIADRSGNLYGTTVTGGRFGGGTVFELAGDPSRGWTETVIHSFSYRSGGHIEDGCNPYANVVFDNLGNLYGTTGSCGAYGGGIVFELTPIGSYWIEKILYNFRINSTDGYDPGGGLAIDPGGNLFGTTILGGAHSLGGSYRGGTVFELTPTDSGEWQETILHSFCSEMRCADGNMPYGSLIFDYSGHLFGTTSSGGGYTCYVTGCGNVFELSHISDGIWTETVLYSFQSNGKDGYWPFTGVIFEPNGNLLGTTSAGGISSSSCGVDSEPPWGCGTIFELAPAGGLWQETILHSFDYNDGANPTAGITSDGVGRYYGTTQQGGTGSCLNLNDGYNGCGTAFEFTIDRGGRILHNFQNDGVDGLYPYGVAVDSSGNVYGATYAGGLWGGGSVFEITPQWRAARRGIRFLLSETQSAN